MAELFKTKKGKIIVASIILAIIAVVAVIMILMQGNKEGFRTISVSEIKGTAKVMQSGKEYDAYQDMKLQEGYALLTGADSYVRMVLDEDKYIKLEADSKLVFETLGKEGSGRTGIILEYGAVTNEAASGLGEDEEYIINTPNSVLAIRGTFFRVEVRTDANGEVLTNVYTYGGVVQSKRIMPDGQLVEEEVLIEAGYKTTVSMDAEETVYVVEKAEDGKEYVEQIKIEDIPDSDLVDIYVAASNGHEMFINVEEIWDVIEEREIEVEDYTSNRDGQVVTPPQQDDSEQEPEQDVEEDSSGEHKHTEKITTVEATCTENGYTKTECEECGEILSEVIIDATGHTEETIIEPATETEEGKTTVKCSSCGEILQEVVIPANHSHTYETVTTEATCTVNGKTVTRCSVCLEVTSEVVIPAKGHTVQESVTEATFTQTGSVFRYCSTCSATLETSTLPMLEPICTDDGDIYITKSGFYTDKNPELIAYTGSQYIITQKSSEQVSCNIHIEENPKMVTLTLDGINILGSINATNAFVGLHGNDTENKITAVGHDSAIKNTKGFVIYRGTWTITSSMYAVEHTGTQFAIFGGVVTIDGGVYDIHGDNIEFCGGSVWLKHGTISGKAYNDGMELESRVYESYPSQDVRAYWVTTYEQWYSLTESEVSPDGKYHIWMPKNQVKICDDNFPDATFQSYVYNNFDRDVNGYLLEDEIASATEVVFLSSWNPVNSLEGIEYLTELTTLQCECESGFTSVDLSKNTKLSVLIITGAPITSLDLSNNFNLKTLYVQDTLLTGLEVSHCSQLKYVDITNCPMAYLNLEGTSVDMNGITSGNNVYTVTGMANGTFDAGKIPGIDISKITNVTGADYDPATGMFTNITGTQLEFIYECATDVLAEFVLKFE